jgi:ribose transport system permease protein
MENTPKALLVKAKQAYMQKSELSVFSVFLSLAVITSILNPAFLTPVSLINLVRAVSLTIIPCIGLTFALGAAEIDLTPGAMVALSGVLCGMFMKRFNIPIVPSVIFALIGAAVGGALIGFVVVQFTVPSMIVTLGFQNVFRGVVNVLTRGSPYANLPKGFAFLGTGTLFGLPFSVYLAVVFLIFGYFLLRHTVFGRSVVAVGGNQETARLAGISVKKYIILVHVLSSVCAGIGGILTTARLGSAQVSIGAGLEMNALAACVIGGTSLSGGAPTLLGTVIGVALMELLTIALTMVKIDVYWQKVILGLLIVAAVASDTYKNFGRLGAKI